MLQDDRLPANYIDGFSFPLPSQSINILIFALFQSRKWQVDGVWDRAQLHLHLRPDIYQKVASLILNHLVMRTSKLYEYRKTLCENHLCQFPSSDPLIEWQQRDLPILIRCARPTELLIVDQLCHLMAGKYHIKSCSVHSKSTSSRNLPQPPLSSPAT